MIRMFFFFLFVTILTFHSFSQEKLSGNVVDEKGNGIANVTIYIEGTEGKSNSKSDGSFTILVYGYSGILHFKMLGYEDERVQFVAKNLIDGLQVRMKNAEKRIEEVEVISTGYQQLPKERSTGAFTQLSENLLNEQVSTDIISRLEAVANGVSVNRTAVGAGELTIRGLSSIQGEKSPLIVVDNFPYEGDLENLNPNDVANITLLKDAAASSIWGARAGNGVIVITTKKGMLNQALTVNLRANMTVSSMPDLYQRPMLSTKDYIAVERFLFANKHRFADTASRSRVPFTPVYEMLFAQQKGEISQEEFENRIKELEKVDIREEYLNTMYRPAFNQQYSLSISSGTDRSTWYFSSGHDRNVNDTYATYKRLNLNFHNTYRLMKDMLLSSGIRYTFSGSENGRTAYGDIRMSNRDLPPYTAFKDENGNFLPITRQYRQGYINTIGEGQLLDWNYYMDDYIHLSNANNLNDIVVNAGVNYTPKSWLKLDLKYQYENQQSERTMLYGEESYFVRNMVNQYTQLRTGNTPLYIVPKGAVYDPAVNNMTSHSLRGQADLQEDIGRHTIVGLLGLEARNFSLDSRNNRFYGYNPEIGTFGRVDQTVSYPNIVTGSRSFIPDNTSISNRENRFISVFANGAYTYDGRYVMTFSARRDASNLFGVNTNDKWNILWSLGGAWNISRERFYNIDWLPYAKLRVTHGVSGNVDLSRSAVTTINFAETNPYTQHTVARFNQFGDPELRWEKVAMTNLAIDFAGRNNRLSGSIDFFFKKGTDLFGPAAIDYTTGTSISLTKNVAALKGKGMDIMLNSLNIKSTNFDWSTNLNVSKYKDEIVSFYRTDINGRFYVTSIAPTMSGVIGKPLYSFYSYKWRGLDQETGDPIGYINGHESKNYNAIVGDSTLVGDLVYQGSAIPLVYGSLGNTFRWKAISLSFRIQYNFAYYYRRESLNYNSLFTSGVGHPEYGQRWQKPGDELATSVPSMSYPANSNRDELYRGADINAERGDHIRLAYVNLSYNLLNNSGNKANRLQQAQVYLNTANLGILWAANKDGIDPEFRRAIPPLRTVSIGTRLTF